LIKSKIKFIVFFVNQTESIFTTQEELLAQHEALKSRLLREQEKTQLLESEVEKLREMLLELKRHRFGKRSERWESEEQGLLFNEAEVQVKKDESAQNNNKTVVKEHTRGHRKALPKELPRRVEVITLAKEEQFLDDGTPLKPIGMEVSEKLIYEPARIEVIEYHRIKYGVDSGDYVKTAPAVPAIIPKGIATPELLSAIVVSKFADGLPLYRQEEIFKRLGVELYRSTMARWMVVVAEALIPVWNVLSDRLMSSGYVSCDETHTQVLKENGKKAESKSWMWVRSTPYGKSRIVLFDYDPARSGKVVKKLLSDFEGFLQVDGFSSYNVLSTNQKIMQIGCNMHGRRYFEKALTAGAKAGTSLAEQALKFYQRLYEIEETLRDQLPAVRYEERLKKAEPIWTELKAWTDQTHRKVPPKSKIGEAFHYFLEQYDHLRGYLKDGRLEMDNGFVERAIRKFAIGRNNWLFSDSVAGANASALLYSIVVTAKINGVNPYKAIKKLCTDLPKAKTIEDFERLADIIVPHWSPIFHETS
jgi:transposase